MPDSDTDAPESDPAYWHRQFGAALFNHSWQLLEKADRTAEEDDELLAAVFASRFHWGRVGDAGHTSVGDNQIARVCAALGLGDLAVHYAAKALAVTEDEGWTDYRLASAHEVVARAAASAGDRETRDQHVALARAAIERLEDPEDREVVGAQLDSVP
jgi:hypothetical protein